MLKFVANVCGIVNDDDIPKLVGIPYVYLHSTALVDKFGTDCVCIYTDTEEPTIGIHEVRVVGVDEPCVAYLWEDNVGNRTPQKFYDNDIFLMWEGFRGLIVLKSDTKAMADAEAKYKEKPFIM